MSHPRKSDDAYAAFVDRFIGEYLKDLNGTAAARRADPALKGPHTCAYKLLQREDVQERIAKAHAERNAAVKVEANEVLRHVLAVATVDPNEIMEVRRGCCRHCHGIEHRYQYLDERELKKARTAFENSDEGLVDPFEHGGIGFDQRMRPAEACPKCGGEGGVYAFIKDTRDLSPAARSLYAGVKQTKDGIEVKLNSQDKSREMLMRHLGLFNDKLEVSGDLGERILRARKRVGGR